MLRLPFQKSPLYPNAKKKAAEAAFLYGSRQRL